MKRIERAILSVWDKTGIVEFARELQTLGVELLSTGGTARALREAGLPVRDISDFTGFPEMLDGRVKTLHPKVHGGLLYLRGSAEHEATAKQHGILPIDLVCVNLYPFEATVARPDVTLEEAIENIDIGGPAMLRSAAKNMRSVTVVTDPADYGRVIESLKAHDGATDEALRSELGRKVYARTAQYDASIAGWLAKQAAAPAESTPLVVVCPSGTRLRYGENPHQKAIFYRDPSSREAGAALAELLHGKEMSYNNYVDADAALEAVREVADVPAAAIIKHTNPCGFATGPSLEIAFEDAWAGDPVSSFGSVIAVTRPVDLATAQRLKGRFVEALIAPAFEPDALAFLTAKSKDIRLLRLTSPLAIGKPGMILRQIQGGYLAQDRDVGTWSNWVVPTETPFPDDKRALAELGVKVCKHVKSNAIVIVRATASGGFALLGMGAGQPNRVDSVRKLAVARAQENGLALFNQTGGYGHTPKDFETELFGNTVLVSDAFFPFPDNIEMAAAAGIRCIVQPGGSVRDEEVIAACDRYGIAMVVTGMRHFRH
ncbi:MAG: bifunctional phosphoribosylaminoimidazolecarboxamide formyltransferase/IMP cyclohydrolase [Kiritimatiellia bacterium]|nr:bifunctional phosphoribosylaminoimidazolecarboxamide formyltransferase/IMP cyclohydrolase [Kiritimatiellia bacterium]